MSQSRHLAAILFADIAGYTAMMQHNEALALNKLHYFKERLTLRVTEERGEIIQYYGDGCLITFTNAVDAVNCAKLLQQDFTKDPHVPVRIGIHLGDIVLDDGNIFGDSVNISSRIQSMGVPGAVLLSDAIKNQIKNKPEFQLTSLGNIEFKNVDDPIEVFALSNSGFPVPDKANLIGKFKEINTAALVEELPVKKKKNKKQTLFFFSLGAIIIFIGSYLVIQHFKSSEKNRTVLNNYNDIKSIAVLPFADFSPGEDQAWFTNGMTDALITELSKISSLIVRSRTSVMQYKGSTKTIPEIARELNVDAVIEGSAVKVNDSVRITAQLINARDKQLWANNYDAGMEDVLRLHHNIAQSITKGINIVLTPADSARFTEPSRVNPAALEADLKGFQIFMESYTIGQVKDAVTHFQQAITIDSTYSNAYAHLATAYSQYHYFCEKTPLEALKMAEIPNNMALRLDPQLTIAYVNEFYFLYYIKWDWDGALRVLTKAQSLSQNDPSVLEFFIFYYVTSGKFDKAFEALEKIRQLSPTESYYWRNKVFVQFHSRDFEGAIKTAEEALKLFPDESVLSLQLQSLAFSMLGRHEEAVKTMRKILTHDQGVNPIELGIAGFIFARAGLKNEAKKQLEIINGLKLNYIDPVSIGLLYLGLGDKDRAIEYFEKGYQIHSEWMVFLKRAPPFDAIRGDPRFEKLVQKLKFP